VTLIYIAGPLFNSHERWYLERVAEALEAAGYRTFLPQRDAGLVQVGASAEERRRVFQTDLDAMQACDLCVAVLTGADHDSGTSAELGYLYARGTPCIGLSDDKRAHLNTIIWGICGYGTRIVRTIEEVVQMVEDLATASPEPGTD
jgi:nucleoside 2-deoxyribosyltransferase